MAKVLVTGAAGLLGSALTPFLEERGHEVVRLGHNQVADVNVDLRSYEQTTYALERAKPEVIINLVALTNVDRCETHPNEAYLHNVKPVENLSKWIKTVDLPCHLIQISTDQVYDGKGPHDESEVTIRNHYAMSKLASEFAAGIVSSTILRTNFVGRSKCEGRLSLTDWLYTALNGSEVINVFDDVMFSPLGIDTLCDCIERCVIKKPLGVFNLGSHEGMSKADFAFAFVDAIGKSTTNFVRGKYSIVGTLAARRPTDMRMQSDKFEKCMELKLPRLIDEIQFIANDYN